MTYSVYKNISFNEYLEFKDILVTLEKKISPIMEKYNFGLTESINKTEGIILDYTTDNLHEFLGSIGFSFDDLPNKKSFSFYVLKAYDEKHRRMYKREYLLKEVDFYVIANSIEELFEKSIVIFNSWDKGELVNEEKF